ncbi:MAG: outer membrane protein assembly factor BamD [Gammaproteobacteria bacterium]|nr:outer membrane protein assembly factor BamD [Gammaproteobacteria bacterium]
MSIRRILIVAVVCAQLAACSWMPFFGRDRDVEEVTSEQVLYQAAQRSLRSGNYNNAIAQLQRLEAQFPFGRYAEQAQLELIYAYYMAFRPDAARSAADRFIRLHPQHANVDYAYYLKGLAAYEQDRGFFDRFVPTDLAARDIGAARESFADFGQLLARYPASDYAPDARQRMIYLRNLLARSEIMVGRYYLSREAYVAAVNRGRNVVENYPTTPSVPDGLALMIEGYLKLNLPEPANDSLRVLAANYPDFQALDGDGNFRISQEVRNRDRSWINILTLGALDRPDTPPILEVRIPEEQRRTDSGGS